MDLLPNLGVTFTELLCIGGLAFILLQPKEWAAVARWLGRIINRFNKSEFYQTVNQAAREFRNIPATLAKEAKIKEMEEELEKMRHDNPDPHQGKGED